MELRNCPVCGKVFLYTTRNLCPECAAKEEEDFKKVRDYLYEVPAATMDEISEKTGVPVKKILDFMKEGRLILKKNNINILLKCERCGEPILTGRYCDKCVEEMKKGFGLRVDNPLEKRSDMKGKIHITRYRRDEN